MMSDWVDSGCPAASITASFHRLSYCSCVIITCIFNIVDTLCFSNLGCFWQEFRVLITLYLLSRGIEIMHR